MLEQFLSFLLGMGFVVGVFALVTRLSAGRHRGSGANAARHRLGK